MTHRQTRQVVGAIELQRRTLCVATPARQRSGNARNDSRLVVHDEAQIMRRHKFASHRPRAHRQLDRGRALLLDGLNRKIGNAMTLTAVIDTVAIRGLYVTPLGLVMRAEETGHASVAVKEQ